MPHSVLDGQGRRWPVLDGIAYARSSRPELAAEALARLDAGDEEGALILLLADQDDWWRGPRAEEADLRRLLRERDRLTLREAMRLLAWGPVADYFAHRWTDPTFLAGLALTEAHWNAPGSAFELACGIGHHLGALAARGVSVAGADVVFAKLWVARHWVAPEAELVCLDAACAPWPLVEGRRFDLVACHDALYFLEPKAEIVARLRGLAGHSGRLVVGHVHNAEWPNLSAGAAITAERFRALLPDALLYDDAELTRAAVTGEAPRATEVEGLRGAEAFAAAAGPGLCPARPVSGLLGLPEAGGTLVRNPLYRAGEIAWPSERYAREYGPLATYPPRAEGPESAALGPETAALARRRELVSLPERW